MTFEFDGEKYTQASTHQREWGNKLIAELELTGDEHILDLGCGDGVLTALLAERVPDGFVLGIDGSQGMIEAAQKRTGENLQFEVMDIANLSVQAEFDVVFSNAALHWIKDHDKLLADIICALKKGGYARLNFAADGNCAHFFRVIREVMERKEYAPHFETFQWPWYMAALGEYRELVERAGFSEIKVWGENTDRYFADAETMVRWIDQPSIVPFLKHVPESQKGAFRDAVVSRMIEETRQKDGTCFETFRRINVLGKV